MKNEYILKKKKMTSRAIPRIPTHKYSTEVYHYVILVFKTSYEFTDQKDLS